MREAKLQIWGGLLCILPNDIVCIHTCVYIYKYVHINIYITYVPDQHLIRGETLEAFPVKSSSRHRYSLSPPLIILEVLANTIGKGKKKQLKT